VLYDVKPLRLINKYAEQFEKTRRLCEAVGWGYEVHPELPRQVDINLSWLAAFRHPGYHPGQAAAERLFGALQNPMPLGVAAATLGMTDLAHGRSAMFHLIWAGLLTLDLAHHLTDNTLIERPGK
jgi:hypothetical protein